ncbi:MAG: hypothetical protein ACI9UN_005328, partial [Granulosicoccus sp.]
LSETDTKVFARAPIDSWCHVLTPKLGLLVGPVFFKLLTELYYEPQQR